MLPPEGTVRAARRWLQLLAHSSFDQAVAIIESDPSAANLTQTQYAAAVDWLKTTGLLERTEYGFAPTIGLRGKSDTELDLRLFNAAIEHGSPPWLADADTLVSTAEGIPNDAADLALILDVPDSRALLGIRQVHGKVDLAERIRVGAAGERELAALLHATWPGSVQHRALEDDGLGYDLEFRRGGMTWHLEVKSTTRRGRLAVHLSRNEHVVAALDPAWRMVAVGLDEHDSIQAIATAATSVLLDRAPQDHHLAVRWDSARHLLTAADLSAGFAFLGPVEVAAAPDVIAGRLSTPRFDWMPTAARRMFPS